MPLRLKENNLDGSTANTPDGHLTAVRTDSFFVVVPLFFDSRRVGKILYTKRVKQRDQIWTVSSRQLT